MRVRNDEKQASQNIVADQTTIGIRGDCRGVGHTVTIGTDVRGRVHRLQVAMVRLLPKWIDHQKASGHTVSTQDIESLDTVKKMAVPEHLQSCHGDGGRICHRRACQGYRAPLLAERPKAKGLRFPACRRIPGWKVAHRTSTT